MKLIYTTILATICLFLLPNLAQGQVRDKSAEARLTAYKAGPQLGDQMPDISLGEVSNNKTGKTRFSEFKGKLVILDFWTTGCYSCINNFPNMLNLQRKYGDKIQIFLVNPDQTQEEIDKEFIELSKISWAKGQEKKMVDLPSIVNAKELNRLFPTPFGVPLHVWIDQNGKIIVRGSFMNTTERNIEKVLAGESLEFAFNSSNSVRPMQKDVPYHTLINEKNSPGFSAGSYFTEFNNSYALVEGSRTIEQKDSVSKMIRSTYANWTVTDLIKGFFTDVVNENRANVLSSNSNNYWREAFQFLVKDTLSVTNLFLRRGHGRSEARDFVKSMYCYEQVLPASTTLEQRRSKMFDDLTWYFKGKLGIDIKSEEVDVPCYLLMKTKDKPTKQLLDESGSRLSDFFADVLSPDFRENNNIIIRNGTDIDGKVSLNVPRLSINSLEELNSALKPYGLVVAKGSKRIKQIVLRDGQYNSK